MTATTGQHCPTCTCDQHTTNDNPNDENSPIYGFPVFWGMYPLRNGKRVGKKIAMDKWGKLKLPEKRLCLRAVMNYKNARGDNSPYVMDAQRFLANEYWKDWVEKPDAPAPRTRPSWAARGPWVAV